MRRYPVYVQRTSVGNTVNKVGAINSIDAETSGRHFADDMFISISWKTLFVFWLQSHWNLLPRIELGIILYWLTQGLVPNRGPFY